MRRLYTLGGLSLTVLLAFTAIFPAVTSAFSAYGAGTISNPYRVATCSQLQEINDNLAGHYKLVSDINCNGASIYTIGSAIGAFSGTFDGKNHTITNFINNGAGLFDVSDGATFKNLKITNATINTTSWAGGLVGTIEADTTIDNVHVSATINNNATGYTGGLVGLGFNGKVFINQSSFSGSISNGSSYEGGLVGAIDQDGSTITDSYATGTFDMTDDVYNGGLVGAFFGATTLTNVYSAFTLNVTDATSSGGIVGGAFNDDSAIVNSFAANTISGSGSDIGAVVGIDPITATNVAYDSTRAGGLDCSGDGGTSCDDENVSNAAPNFFKNNFSNGPLSQWNFDTIWQTNVDGYPTLRNQAGFTPASVPHSGDANGDGTADNYQANVASVPNADDVWSTIEIPSTGSCTLDNPSWQDASYYKVDTGFTSQLSTMTAFEVYCPNPGATVPVTLIYDKQYDTSHSVLRHYNPTTNTYSTVTGAVFGTRTIGGVVKSTVTYNVTDGESYDTDGVANGVIKDPVGFSIPPTAPSTGYGTGSKNTLVLIVYAALSISGIGLGIRSLRRRYNN